MPKVKYTDRGQGEKCYDCLYRRDNKCLAQNVGQNIDITSVVKCNTYRQKLLSVIRETFDTKSKTSDIYDKE